MRSVPKTSFTAFLLILALLLIVPVAHAQLKAGTAVRIIPLAKSEKLSDPDMPLKIRVLALQEYDAPMAFVAIDAAGNPDPKGIQALLRKANPKLVDRVFVMPSHTHEAGTSGRNPEIKNLILEAVLEAVQNLAPAKMGVGRGAVPMLAICRVDITSHRTRWCFDPLRKNQGPVDWELGVVRVDSTDGKPIAVLYNYAAHPIIGEAISPDYPGYVSAYVEKQLGNGALALFSYAAAGNQSSPFQNFGTIEAMKVYEDKMGNEVLRVWKDIEAPWLPQRSARYRTWLAADPVQDMKYTLQGMRSDVGLVVRQRCMVGTRPGAEMAGYRDLAKRNTSNFNDKTTPNPQDNAAVKEIASDVFAVFFRNLETMIVTAPGEPFVEVGLDFKMWAPVLHAMVVSQVTTGDSFGYMAPEKYFKYDWHYGVYLATRGRAEQLLETWLDIAKDVFPDTKTPADFQDRDPSQFPYFGRSFIPYAESDVREEAAE